MEPDRAKLQMMARKSVEMSDPGEADWLKVPGGVISLMVPSDAKGGRSEGRGVRATG